MNQPRLIILAVIAAVAVALAAYVASDHEPATPAADPAAKASAQAAPGVAPRGSDTPFELRERERLNAAADDPSAAAVAPAPAAAASPEKREHVESEEPLTVVSPPASPTIEASMAAAKAAAEDAVAEVRSDMRRKCWDTVDRGGIGEAELGFSLTFDAEGRVIASAVQQGREGYIQGLDTCLGPFAHALAVPAPGEPVSVDVTFELP
jgi:hypothetical protein